MTVLQVSGWQLKLIGVILVAVLLCYLLMNCSVRMLCFSKQIEHTGSLTYISFRCISGSKLG